MEILKSEEISVICLFEAGHGSPLSWTVTSLFFFDIFLETYENTQCLESYRPYSKHQHSLLGWFSFPFLVGLVFSCDVKAVRSVHFLGKNYS